jgi:hypothetical protein
VEPDIAREELLKLGAYRMAVVTRERGSRLPAFLVNTMPPPSAIEPLADAAAFPVYAPLTAEEVSTYLAQRYQVKRPAVSNTPETSDGLRDYD